MSAPALLFFLYGVLSLVSQLLLLQELLILFSGHELFLGLSLAAWMGWVGFGSWISRGKISIRFESVILGLIPLLILNLIAIRLAKLFFGFGMLVGLLPMLVLTLLCLAPIGLAIGLFFTLGCQWTRQRYGSTLGFVYLWETVGAAAGGLLYSWVIAGRLSPEWTLFLMTVLVTLLVLQAAPVNRKWFALFILFVGLGFALSPLPQKTRTLQWRGYEFLKEHYSRYSHLVLARTGSLTTLFENGVISYHFPDPSAYEELIHWPLLLHPSPEKILIIGGAASGSLTEILKHPVKQVDHVELDPSVTRLLKSALSPTDQAALNDPRVHLIHQDGRRWLSQAKKRYDVILLQLPEPLNAQINRLYTLEAFEQMRRHLKTPSGLVAFTIPSGENYLTPEIAYFNASLYRTLKAAFPSVELIAGNPILLVAGENPISFNLQHLFLRYQQRNLTNQVVIPEYMPIKLDPRRRSLLVSQLTAIRHSPINRDFTPVSYAYAWRVWFSKFVSPVYFLGMILLATALLFLLRAVWRRRSALAGLPGPTALFFLGFAGILYETVLILAFQSLNGYVYWQLGTLFAAFMIGLAIGSGVAVALFRDIKEQKAQKGLKLLLILTGAEGILLWRLLPFLQQHPPLSWLIPFSLLLIMTGLWLGLAFPIAGRQNQAGTLYAADLWGAALGALLTSAFLVPTFGLTIITAAMGGVLFIAAVLLPS